MFISIYFKEIHTYIIFLFHFQFAERLPSYRHSDEIIKYKLNVVEYRFIFILSFFYSEGIFYLPLEKLVDNWSSFHLDIFQLIARLLKNNYTSNKCCSRKWENHKSIINLKEIFVYFKPLI